MWACLLWPVSATSQSPAPEADKLAPVKSSVTVVGKLEVETPANLTLLGAPELERIPGVNLDDRLRMVPGFSLFRRSSSLVANPTTQGVSLRGIGSSGASRTLVLWDGIPVNDPFGGWVYWTRFSPEHMDRVELMRGASTSVFGDRAMGGAIALFSRPADRARVHGGWESGNRGQHLLNAGFAQPFRKFALSANLRGFTTDGYYIVPQRLRGRADTKASVQFLSPDARFDYFGDRHRLYLKADLLVEDRDNGTVLQRNSTGLGTVSAHYASGVVNHISISGFHTRQEYHQSFSTIAAGRNSETLTSRQTVPSEASGGALLFRQEIGKSNLLAGVDAIRVEGLSIDSLVPTGKRIGGGVQFQRGFFGQFHGSAGPVQLFGGLRQHFTGQGSRFLSPSGGLTIGRRFVRGRVSGYRSFRAPTLNELFREFRAGNAVTQPNAALRPESLSGVEAGLDLVGETRRLGFTLFRNSISDIITNVTLSSTPALIVRQRRNATAALSRGAEIDFRQRWRWFHAEASYLYADSRFQTRERLPQIPRHQGSAQLSFVREGTLAAFGMRSFAAQFEDDRNLFLLPGYAALQFSLRQRVGRGVSALFSMENALNRTFLVGFSPTPLTGAPRLWRLGLRWDGAIR